MSSASNLNSHIETATAKKINKALKLLDSIESEEVDTLQDKLMSKYDSAKEQISQKANEVNAGLIYGAKRVDKSAHDRPWKFIGGAAVLAAAAGFLLGSRRK